MSERSPLNDEIAAGAEMRSTAHRPVSRWECAALMVDLTLGAFGATWWWLGRSTAPGKQRSASAALATHSAGRRIAEPVPAPEASSSRATGEPSVTVPAKSASVATVDKVGREKSRARLWPVSPAAGQFGKAGRDGRTMIDSDNQLRGAPLVNLFESVDPECLVVNGGEFEVLSVEVRGSAPLSQPGSYLAFADPTIDRLPSGQKLMVRTGLIDKRRLEQVLSRLRVALPAPETLR